MRIMRAAIALSGDYGRSVVEPEDKAGMYLLRAIARTTGARRSLIDFNDGTNGSRRTYADIRFVIRRAREFAEQDAQGQA